MYKLEKPLYHGTSRDYMTRVCSDLMQITASLIRARQALAQLPLDSRVDAVLASRGGEAFDAVVTAYTLAELLLRDYPLSMVSPKRISPKGLV